MSKKAVSGRMPSISPFGPSAACSTSAGTGSEVKTTLVCSPSQGRKQPPGRVGGLFAIKSVIKNKAGEREGVRLPISGKSEGGAALERQVPPRARCRSRESCPQVLLGAALANISCYR